MARNAAQAVADARGARRGEGGPHSGADGGRAAVASGHDDGDGTPTPRAPEVRRARRVVGAALRRGPGARRRVGVGRRDVGEAEVAVGDVADGGRRRGAVAGRGRAGADCSRGAAGRRII